MYCRRKDLDQRSPNSNDSSGSWNTVFDNLLLKHLFKKIFCAVRCRELLLPFLILFKLSSSSKNQDSR